MNRINNVQTLFQRITLQQLTNYLRQSGWQLQEDPSSSKLLFVHEASALAEEPNQLWIWASEEHPKFRSRIPNAIFALSVFESREPIDIASDVHACNIVADVPVVESQAVLCFRIRNVGAESLQCTVDNRHDLTQSLASQGSLEFRVKGSAGDMPEVQFGPQTIIVRSSAGTRVQVFQGLAGEHVTASVSQIVREELERCGGSDAAQASFRERLQPVLSRADFEWEAKQVPSTTSQQALRRQVAVVAAALAHQGMADATLQNVAPLVWHVSSRMAAAARLRLELTSTAMEDLCQLAAADDASAPTKTLHWLQEHAIDLMGS